MNKDEIQGKVEQVKGKIKEGIGNATDDDELVGEGQADQAVGTVQEGYGRARRKVGEAIEDIGETVKK